MNKQIFMALVILSIGSTTLAQGQHRQQSQRDAFQTETPMVHDPVMAKEDGTYYIYMLRAWAYSK